MRARVLLLDCVDSFVHTLARYAREAGAEAIVRRADEIDLADAVSFRADAVVLSPGPGRPEGAGIALPLVAAMPDVPILGVCLGHQAICQAYGGATTPSPDPMHGRASLVSHDGSALFAGLPNPFRAARYHSLIGEPGGALEVTARAGPLVMGVRHRDRPHHGVQFHPESLLTEGGHRLVENFVAMAR